MLAYPELHIHKYDPNITPMQDIIYKSIRDCERYSDAPSTYSEPGGKKWEHRTQVKSIRDHHISSTFCTWYNTAH